MAGYRTSGRCTESDEGQTCVEGYDHQCYIAAHLIG